MPSARARLLAYARTLLGVPYEINLPGYRKQPGRGLGKRIPPDGGIDCSGYVLQVLNHVGVFTGWDPLYTDVGDLSAHCKRLDPKDARPGDLVFFANTYQPGLSHIGIVTEAGGGAMINAREPRVSEDRLDAYWRSKLSHYGRPEGLP